MSIRSMTALIFAGIAILCFPDLAKSEDMTAEHFACTWCSSDSDFELYIETQVIGRPNGTYSFYVGNPMNDQIRYVTAYVENEPEPAPPLLMISVQSAEQSIVQEFGYVASKARGNTLVEVDPDLCGQFSCENYDEAMQDTSFLLNFFYSHVLSVQNSVSSARNWIIYTLAANVFNRHHEFILVFPNGDSVKVALMSLTVQGATALSVLSATAVNEDGDPIDGGSGSDHHGGGYAGGGFIVRVSQSGLTIDYLCSSSNIPGSTVHCEPL